jgi:hypothetical protein
VVGGEGFIIANVDIAALLALAAALISGIGDVVRQRSAQEITDEQVGHVELLRMSLRDVKPRSQPAGFSWPSRFSLGLSIGFS